MNVKEAIDTLITSDYHGKEIKTQVLLEIINDPELRTAINHILGRRDSDRSRANTD
jgi:hypothetical protein